MSRFALKYTNIKKKLKISIPWYIPVNPRDIPKEYVLEGPEVDDYKDIYWFYHAVNGFDPKIPLENLGYASAVESNNGLRLGVIHYALIDRQKNRYIWFYTGTQNNRSIRIEKFEYFPQENKVEKNFDNYKGLINEIIRIVSLINEKKENENNKTKLIIEISAIENYTEDKQKWETTSDLGKFVPDFYVGEEVFNKEVPSVIKVSDSLINAVFPENPNTILRWIPEKKKKYLSGLKNSPLAEPLLVDEPDIVHFNNNNLVNNNNLGYIPPQYNDNNKQIKNGGKRKSRKSRKSKKSKKRNYSNKNH